MVEHQASDGKVASLRFDFRAGIASLCPWERHLDFSGVKLATRGGGPADKRHTNST